MSFGNKLAKKIDNFEDQHLKYRFQFTIVMMHLGLSTVPTLRDCVVVGECTFDYKYIYKYLK